MSLLNRQDLIELGFQLGQAVKIQNYFSPLNKSNNENDDKNKLEILKNLSSVKSSLEGDQLDPNFSIIITDKIDESLVKTGLERGNLIESIKPYMFDSLKRFNRFNELMASILKHANKNGKTWGFMSKTSDRDLLCALVQTTNIASRPKLGTLIVKNDFPLPLLFTKHSKTSK